MESHRAFAKSLTIGFPLVADPDKKVSRLYGVGGVFSPGRVTFVIDHSRVIRAVYKSSFNIAGHVDESLKALRSLFDEERTRAGAQSS